VPINFGVRRVVSRYLVTYSQGVVKRWSGAHHFGVCKAVSRYHIRVYFLGIGREVELCPFTSVSVGWFPVTVSVVLDSLHLLYIYLLGVVCLI